MRQRLIIDGNAVYELDEKCMLRKRIDTDKKEKEKNEKREKRGRG